MSSGLGYPVFHKTVLIKASDNVNSLAFSVDGKFLASGRDDGFVSIFKTKHWEEFRKYQTVSAVRIVMWHPVHSGVLVAGLKNGIINIIQTKNNMKWEHDVPGTIHCMSFGVLGKFLAIGFNDQVLIAQQSSICMNVHQFTEDI
ncbi:hypothetical protein K438DRAFT_1614369 [Mycena galopus ATCC 62051]|nr:hypothetical protein K438DRAFT_1614369 [Mycena galopus ATCC 62051]